MTTAGALPLPQWLPAGPARSSDEGRLNGDPRQNIDDALTPSTAHGGDAVNSQQTDWLDEHHHAVSALLMQRGFVPLYPQLVQASGSLKSALMLGQAIGLSRTWLQRDRSRNGWFWMSAADWQNATGLTPREQEAARESLVEADLWEERRTHNPSRLYFRVHLNVVAEALGLCKVPPMPSRDAGSADDWRWDDSAATRLLGEAQMFFKPLADLAGGVMAGLLLSQLLARQRIALHERHVDAQGLFRIQYDKVADQLLIGQKVMRNARDQLRRAGFISEQVRGSGPAGRVHVGVNLAAMMACLQVQPSTAMGRRVAAARLAKTRPAQQRPITATPSQPTIASSRQSSDAARSAQLSLIDAMLSENQGHTIDLSLQDEKRVFPDVALLSIAKRATTPSVDNVAALLSVAEASWCPFVESEGALLSIPYTEIEYREPPPTRARETAVDNSDAGRRGSLESEAAKKQDELLAATSGLVAPAGVDRTQAIRLVETAPTGLRQALLDELAGHMRSKRKNIDSPIGYLHVITRKAVAGTFVPTIADEVARVRRAQADAARRLAPITTANIPPATVSAQGSVEVAAGMSEEADAARAKLRVLRASITAKAALGSIPGLAASNAQGGQHDE